MSLIFVLSILLDVSFGARKDCVSPHSSFYTNNYGKTNVLFFAQQTYKYNDPCEPVTNNNFRNNLYPQYKEGRDVDHIVDISNSEEELSECDKNIMGNLVLADSGWNRGVGNLCWRYVKAEKQMIYGDIFDRAMYNVRYCCGLDTPTYRPTTNPTTPPTTRVNSQAPTFETQIPYTLPPVSSPNPTRYTQSPTYKPTSSPTKAPTFETQIPLTSSPTKSDFPTNSPTIEYRGDNINTILFVFIILGIIITWVLCIGGFLWFYHFRFKPQIYEDANL